MKKELITHEDPKSPVSEMFRTLRTNIQFMNTDEGIETILITSTLPGEGKSWIASNLAVTFAQAGKRVILIDADMRKGRQYNIFEVTPRPGLSNYLSGVINGEKIKRNSDIDLFIKETKVNNLYLIPAGNVPPNPSELLVSQKMNRLIRELKTTYDVIIFDGTPSLLVADAIILSRLVDTTLIVSAHKETKMDNLEKVKRTIENVGGNIAGVILNKVPISGKKYDDTYYYGNTSKHSFDIQNIEQIKNTTNLEKQTENNNEIKPKQAQNRRTTKPKDYSDTTIKRTIKSAETEEKDTLKKEIKPNNQIISGKDFDNDNYEVEDEMEENRTRDILAQINRYLDKK